MHHTNVELSKTIGIFNDSFPPIMDGVSIAIKNYAYWLTKMNQPVCIVTPKSPNYIDHESYPIYRYTSMPLLGRKPYRIGLPDIDRSFKQELNNIHFGLVHAHCPFTSGRLALNIAKKQKIPFIATFHSKYRDDFERSIGSKYIVRKMTADIIQFFEKADEVWIPQASVEETLREYGYKGKIEVVNNGNDFESFNNIDTIKSDARKKLKVKDNELMFLFVGQHIWEKNPRLILETLAEIRDLPFKMFFVGTGYAQTQLKELTERMQLSSKVQFAGTIMEREIIKQYYAAADLFLFPSIYDNAPLVIREAAALQTPSVLISGSSSAENIINNFNGFLIENSVESFTAILKELAKSPEKIKIAGVNASQTIARSWESITAEVFDRYKNLILRKNPTNKSIH